MQNLINKHVQLITTWPAPSYQCGVLQLSEVGDEFIKLIPWDNSYQLTHKPWMTVRGELHIRKADIRGIVDIDTIDGKAIEELGKSYEGNNPS